jgi:predicted DNA-binding protein (MmcQ/YjbR family)
MSRDEFNVFCKNLPATTHVVQWGNADVWKVGGKVFAICGWNKGTDAFTFKASEIAFEVLREMPGIRPAPYLASRGFKWLQHYKSPGLSDEELMKHITYSHEMVASGLTKKKQKELGIG